MNGVRISIPGRNHGIPKKHGETRVSLLLKVESCMHMFGLLQASGYIIKPVYSMEIIPQ